MNWSNRMTQSNRKRIPPASPPSSGHMPAKGFRTLSYKILLCANNSVSCIDFLREITKMVSEFSGCDRVELHLKKEDEHYHFKLHQNSNPSTDVDFIHRKHKNSSNGATNEPDCNPFEKIRKTFQELSPIAPPTDSTGYGSFWTGNSSESRLYEIDRDLTGENRVYPRGDRYLSWAVIPMINREEAIGFMLLKSCKANYLSEEDIEFYENIAQEIVLAFVNLCIHANLCERVKELTCLYNLALLNERLNITMDEIFQGAVHLLPSAWQYPNRAAGRIVFDGRSYQTADYRPSAYTQSADIHLSGQKRGSIEVVYLEEKPEMYEGPFLKEERNLLDVLARQISLLIQRRQADEEKSFLQDQLRHADRLATIGQLSAGVAHELNEPLGTIMGFAQLAKKHPDLPASIVRDLDKIVTTTLHAREIVKKLMYFARQTPPRKEKVNLNHVVEETLSLLESRCVANNITLRRCLSPGFAIIHGDPSQLHQVLVNLVVNAIQAMPEGGAITITTETCEQEVRLSVRDTGIGMNEKTIEQLFIPFFTTKDVGEGTGLGLPVAHGIVAAHGGTIRVDSIPQKGSCFEIRFPAVMQIEMECETDGRVAQ
jgi:signal transduction histidine kinase